jgi:hypothetical protein
MEYDVFIAYHGTNDEFGSLPKATELYIDLSARGINCYFFKAEPNAYFGMTPQAAQESKRFLLVCNSSLSLNDGKIAHNGVEQELAAFYNLVYNGKRKQGDARCYLFDGLDAKTADQMHMLFNNVAHFDEEYSSNEQLLQELENWILLDTTSSSDTHVPNTTTIRKPATLTKNTSKELQMVFPRRAMMTEMWDFRKMLSVASSVEAIGISINELTIKMDQRVIENALQSGCEITLLFLDPKGKNIKVREKEEGQEKNTIVNNTKSTINLAKRIKFKNTKNNVFDNLMLYKYDIIPRMNMIFIDKEHLLLQYYATTISGSNNPCFYFRKIEGSTVFDAYYSEFQKIKDKAKRIDSY